MQPLQQVLENPSYFKGLRTLSNLPSNVWVVDDDKAQYPNADFTTIQAAVDAAKEGDTILVFPGSYNEAVTISKPLTLYGNGAYINPLPTNRINGESNIDNRYPVTITSSNVTLCGFELSGFYNGVTIPSAAFIAPDFSLSNLLLRYNYLHAQDAWTGIYVQGGSLDHYEISHSIIDIHRASTSDPAYALACISFSKHDTAKPQYSYITIRSNILRNQSNHYNLFAGATPSQYTIEHCVIECNHFISSSDAVPDDGANFNIGNINDGRLDCNVIEGAPGSIGIVDGSVSGNLFLHGGYLKLWGNEYGFTRPSERVKIEHNVFTNEIHGNGVHLRPGTIADTITTNYNSFEDASIAPSSLLDIEKGRLIRNDTSLVHHATLNWWGTSSGPDGNTGKIYGPTISKPWIKHFKTNQSSTCKLCWPLSTFLKKSPGFYPQLVTGISFVGDSCFEAKDCIELDVLVAFTGGTGKNIPVELTLCGRHYCSYTSIGGYGAFQIGCLRPGTYTVDACTGDYIVTTSIHVKCCHQK